MKYKVYWKIEPNLECEPQQLQEKMEDLLVEITMNPHDYIGFDEVGEDLEIGEPRVEKIKVFYADEIPEDVLERLDGLEDLSNTDKLECQTHLFSMGTFEKIWDNPDDDTNESTLTKMKNLFYNLTERWVMIIYN